ncbi:MAG TPA: hypothetical protein VGX92_22190 [Pyrinomonadaceae bacterium]|nr:hypothetical protein [Pyrinomonadaceae bacterium]
MRDTLLSVALMLGILVLSAIVTNWFARTMYNRCGACGTLNAKRRANCRACNAVLP